MSEFAEILKKETKQLAVETIELTRAFPRSAEGIVIQKQLIRSVSSVAANYRSACRGRSQKDFLSKLSIALEELDETQFWLELSLDLGLTAEEKIKPLDNKLNKLLKILSASKNTLKQKIHNS